MTILDAPVATLKGVGPALAAKLERIGIHTALDLVLHLPTRYQDRTRIVPFFALSPGMEALVQGRVTDSNIQFGRRRSWLLTLEDETGRMNLRFFHFSERQRKALTIGMHLRAFGEVRLGPQGIEMIHPEYQTYPAAPPPPRPELSPIYPTTEGLSHKRLAGLTAQALERLGTWSPPDLSTYLEESAGFGDLKSSLAFLHRPPIDAPAAALESARRRVALDELLANILVLKARARARKHEHATPLPRARRLGAELLRRLGFELTTAQRRVTREVLVDLERDRPMLRLIQGDVGSGKTIVAAFAAIRAAEHDAQTAIMAPTEILAEQHFLNFFDWLTPLGIDVCLLTGQLPAAERAARIGAIATGQARVVVGTHALFQKGVEFKNLALVIIDEQHRFGVHQRMALRAKGTRPHQLVLTATPIPRTLTMALYADMDVSIIDELPRGRQPIETRLVSAARREAVMSRIAEACARGRQVYWVCPLIEDSEALELRAAETTASELRAALPGLRIGLLHGRLPGREKARVMTEFKGGVIDLLVATTVVEVGVDVPNATLMVIDNPERLGLAQLHQLRGRVGRGAGKSHCILLYAPPLGALAEKRLKVMRSTQDGFRIAESDLELRGPGDVLGPRQTGEQQFRVVDLGRDASLVGTASALAGQLLESAPELARQVVALWNPGEQDYASV